MPSVLQAEPPFYSTMGSHREFARIIIEFVAELPKRVHKIVHFAESCDWQELATQAQQIKSLAGTYGFFELTESARRLEAAAGHGYETRSVMSALNRFISVSGRCKAGVPN